MAKQFSHTTFVLTRVLAIYLLLCASSDVFSQTTDSCKTKNPNFADTSGKYGYAKIAILEHVRKVALPALKDSDGDGVPDQLDLEPNTPPGAEVDSHGRAIDTDGDGVPDYKDKEKLTQQRCFPVDRIGVGFCPEPACCKEIRQRTEDIPPVGDQLQPILMSLPSITFKRGSAKLSPEAIVLIDSISDQMKIHHDCTFKIYASGKSNSEILKLQKSRQDKIIEYLVTKRGIDENKLSIDYYSDNRHNDMLDIIPTCRKYD